MDKQEGFYTKKSPLFYISNYVLWSIRMKTYLIALGIDIWSAFKNGYTIPTTPPIDTTRKRLNDNNSKGKNAILCDLAELVFFKVMHFCSTREMWDKLQKIYERDDKVKKVKLQTHRG